MKSIAAPDPARSAWTPIGRPGGRAAQAGVVAERRSARRRSRRGSARGGCSTSRRSGREESHRRPRPPPMTTRLGEKDMTTLATPAAQAEIASRQMAAAARLARARPMPPPAASSSPRPASRARRAMPLPEPNSSSVRGLPSRHARQSMMVWPTSARELVPCTSSPPRTTPAPIPVEIVRYARSGGRRAGAADRLARWRPGRRRWRYGCAGPAARTTGPARGGRASASGRFGAQRSSPAS